MRKTAYSVKLRQKQRQYRTSSSSILGIHVLIENWIFSVYQVLLLNDKQIEKIDYWCQKSATLWFCPLPKKTGQPVAQHRQTRFCYFTSLASKKKITYEPPRDKTNKTACAPREDSEQPGHPPSLIRVFAVRIKKAWVLSYPLSAQRRLWLDWADAQADLTRRWAHSHFVGFVTRRLILKTPDSKVFKIELNERYLFALFNRFLSWHPRHPFFPCHLSRHYENSSHVSCRVKKIHAMVKVDETGAKSPVFYLRNLLSSTLTCNENVWKWHFMFQCA